MAIALMLTWACAACSSPEEIICDRMDHCLRLDDKDACEDGLGTMKDRDGVPPEALERCAECVDTRSCGEAPRCADACAGVLRFPRELRR